MSNQCKDCLYFAPVPGRRVDGACLYGKLNGLDFLRRSESGDDSELHSAYGATVSWMSCWNWTPRGTLEVPGLNSENPRLESIRSIEKRLSRTVGSCPFCGSDDDPRIHVKVVDRDGKLNFRSSILCSCGATLDSRKWFDDENDSIEYVLGVWDGNYAREGDA